MPENEIKKTPVEQLQMDTAPAAVPEVPAPAAPANRQLTYAEKVQGLTANERIWTLSNPRPSQWQICPTECSRSPTPGMSAPAPLPAIWPNG